MIEFWLVELYIDECLVERVPRLASKHRIVDTTLTNYVGKVAEIERTKAGDPTWPNGMNSEEVWPYITIVYIERENDWAAVLLRNAATVIAHELGDDFHADFTNKDVILVYPGMANVSYNYDGPHDDPWWDKQWFTA